MNKDKRNNIQLLGTLNNADESGIIANANQIYDANEDKSTQDVSKEHKERIETLETKESSMQTTLENISKTGEASAASNVTYNHNDSKLDATNVQQAVDEISTKTVFDISAYHATDGTLATYDNLEDALGTDGKNIPQSLRKGGMSVKFVQSSDNKYVQYRCTADEFTIDITKWCCEYGSPVSSTQFVAVVTDKDDKILYAIRRNGDFFFGAGVPQQIIDYVLANKNSIEEQILSERVRAMATEATKVDKIEGKSLIDSNYAENIITLDSEIYLSANIDVEGKILSAVKRNGSNYFPAGIEASSADFKNAQVYSVESAVWSTLVLDAENKILFGIKKNGGIVSNLPIPKIYVDNGEKFNLSNNYIVTNKLKKGVTYRITLNNQSLNFADNTKGYRCIIKDMYRNDVVAKRYTYHNFAISVPANSSVTIIENIAFWQNYQIQVSSSAEITNIQDYLYKIHLYNDEIGGYLRNDVIVYNDSTFTSKSEYLQSGKSIGKAIFENNGDSELNLIINEVIPSVETFNYVPSGEDTNLFILSESDLTVTLAEMVRKGQPIIFDTDFAWDIDDLCAIRLLHWAHKSGMVDLMCVVVNTLINTSAAYSNSLNIETLDAVFADEQVDYIPIGINKNNHRLTDDHYHVVLKNDYHSLFKWQAAVDAVPLMRKCLSQLADGEKIKYLSVGHLNNLYNLLISSPDKYSSLNGYNLIQEKISEIYIMGGAYPSGKEFNFYAFAPQQAKYFVENCPSSVPIYFVGIGYDIITCSNMENYLNEDDFIVKGYNKWREVTSENGRSSWDPLTTLAMFDKNIFSWVKGTNYLSNDGSNNFIEGEGNHYYARRKYTKNFYIRYIDEVMKHLAWIDLPNRKDYIIEINNLNNP